MDDQRLLRLYTATDTPLARIAHQLGATPGDTIQRLRALDAPPRPRPADPAPTTARASSRHATELRHLYIDQALTVEEVGRRLGVSKSTAGQWVRELGLPRRQDKPCGIDQHADWLRSLHADTSLTHADIAVGLGVSTPTVANWSHRLGLPARRYRREVPRPLADWDRHVAALRREGQSKEEIATTLGLTTGQVQGSLRRSGQRLPAARDVQGQRLRELWADPRLTLAEIAAALGPAVSVSQVRRWGPELKLPPRARGTRGREITAREEALLRNWWGEVRNGELCERLGVSQHVLRRWAQELRLPDRRVGPRRM